ncbi:MAG: nitronate monooxygenase [Steroidobacteraceae bacterium]
MQTPFTRHAGVAVPLICGPMYPCSNPELIAAVSEAGGLGVVQPIALTYVHGHELRAGLRYIRTLTTKPVGFNALIEASSRAYLARMSQWIDVALEEGLRFFITSLGDPRWVCERVHAAGGVVYHDVTEARWARKAVDGGADGLIAVNARAGGHSGSRDAAALLGELRPFGLPVVAAGGIGTPQDFAAHLRMGYVAAQLGTRFIATPECRASDAYKQAILAARPEDIVHTERLTGVPVAVIRNAWIDRLGTRAGPFARWMLHGRRRKHWMRAIYTLRSMHGLRGSLASESGRGYWQAGMSVGGIDSIVPAGEIVRRFNAALGAES